MFRIIDPANNLTVRNEKLGTSDLRNFGERHRDLERGQIDLTHSREEHSREIGELAARQNLEVRNRDKLSIKLHLRDLLRVRASVLVYRRSDLVG